jgi:hypothetical protein
MIEDATGESIELGSYILFNVDKEFRLGKVVKMALNYRGAIYITCFAITTNWRGQYQGYTSVLKKFERIFVIDESTASLKYPEQYKILYGVYNG